MGGLYTRVAEMTVDRMELYGTWVAVEESLGSQTRESGLVELEKKATTVGRVLGVGVKVAENLRPGDIILYEQWQGGRWDIGDQKLLIMDIENVLMIVERED